jgi:hypothetical protein
MAEQPGLIRLGGGWILRAGRDYSPGKGITPGAIVLTDAELRELRALLDGSR